MYELNGFLYSLEEVQAAAEKNGISVDDYISSKGMKLTDPNFYKATSNDDVLPGALLNEPEDRSFWEEIYTAWQMGSATGGSVNEAFDVYKQGADISDEDLQNFIDKANAINNIQITDDQFRYQNQVRENGGGIFGTLKALFDNPTYIPQFITTSMATLITSLGDSEEVMGYTAAGAGVGAGAGAGVGSLGFSAGPFGVVTTAGGAITGGTAGAFTGLVGSMETGLTLTELLRDELDGAPFTKENIRAILEDEETVERIKDRSLARGVAIGAVEGLTIGLSRGVGGNIYRTAKGLGKTGKMTGAKIFGATTGIEAAGGFGGEVAGQAAAGQDIDLGEATLEAIGEIGPASVAPVADILTAGFKNAEYKINGKNASKAELRNLVTSKNLSTEEIAKLNLEVIGDNEFNSFIKEKINDAALETQIDAKVTNANDRKTLVNLHKQRVEAETNANKKGIHQVPGAEQSLQNINLKIDAIINKYAGVDGRTKAVKDRAKIAKDVREFTADKNFKGGLEFARKHAGLYNLEVVDNLSAQEIKDQYTESQGEGVERSNGFITDDGKIIINSEVAKTQGIEGANVANHELLHGIIKASGQKIKQSTVKDFLKKIGADNRAAVEKRIADNSDVYTEEYLKQNPDEYFTIFSDAIETGDAKFNDGIFSEVKDIIRRLFQELGLAKVDFESAKGVYNFLKDYNRSIHKGALSQGVIRDTQGEGAVGGKRSVSTELAEKVENKQLQSDIKTELDKYTGPAENRKYATNEEFQASQDFPNALMALNEHPAIERKIEKEFIRYNVTPTPDKIQAAKDVIQNKFLGVIETEGKKGVEFDASRNSLFGWLMGKTPILTKAVNTVIKKETQQVKKGPSLQETFGDKGGLQLDPADPTDINSIVENNLDNNKNIVRSKVGRETMYNGEPLFDKEYVKDLREQAKDLLGKNIDITSEEFVDFAVKKFNEKDGLRARLQKKIGNEKAYKKFMEENHQKPGDPFQEGNISLADLVQMEKMVDEKVFIKEIERNIGPKKVDAAIAMNKLPKDTNRTSGPTLYDYAKPSVNEKVNFIYGVTGSKRGTRKDRTFLLIGTRALFDMLVTEAKATKAPEKKVSKLAKNLDVPYNIRFSSSNYVEYTNEDLISLWSRKNKNIKNYNVDDVAVANKPQIVAGKQYGFETPDGKMTSDETHTGIDRYADDMIEIAKIFEKKYGHGFIGLSMLSQARITGPKGKKHFNVSSKQRDYISARIKANLPNISKVSEGKKWVKTKIDKKIIKQKSNSQLKDINKKNMMVHKEFWMTIKDIVDKDPGKVVSILHMLDNSQNEGSHIQRAGAEYIGGNKNKNLISHFEHALQNANTYRMLLDAAVNQNKENFNKIYKATVDNYKIIGLSSNENALLNKTDFKDKMSLDQSWTVFDNSWLERYFNKIVGNFSWKGITGIDPNNLITLDNKTFAEAFNIDIEGNASNGVIEKAKSKSKYKQPKVLKFSKSNNKHKILNDLNNFDKALKNAQNLDAPKKGMSVFDFDDTLATTKSKILVTHEGKTIKITPAEFAKRGHILAEAGATFNFDQFNKVIGGKPGPLVAKLKKQIDKFGNKNVFILTARPQQSAVAIHQFLLGINLNVPVKNIIGLEDGSPKAKAQFFVDRAAEGFNDFYFVDDAIKNVKAVQEALDLFDVKSKTRVAHVDRVTKLDKDFNDIIEGKTGIGAEKEYSKAKAEVVGANKGRFNWFIPPSAEDFVGLMYQLLGKGKQGNAQMAWLKKNLLDPYARAMGNISRERIALMDDYKALKKQLSIVPKNLKRKLTGEPYTVDHAVRAYIWSKQGMEIPGLPKTDLKTLIKYVENNKELKVFGDQLININKKDGYSAPQKGWLAGTITTDLMNNLSTTKRSKHLEVWQQNADIIFSEKNMNKLEAAFGKTYRTALENMLERMKTGRNRNFTGDTMTGKVTDWLTNSIGTIMFFNTRSALLQTISAVNFINFGDNNILKAGQAYANQPQFWSDFMRLMNSNFLVDRRRGLRINVNEADIANMAREGGPRGVISKMLEFGFLPTQIADSFAIASGGASFYRNRINTYKKQGLSKNEARDKAFLDFREIAEESQQSSRADRISMEQAGPLGRIILAFANTPAQYARLIKKAALDLRNGRGDKMTNISKIIYYGAIQNLVFNAMQQALFAVAFGDIEDEKELDKYWGTVNGMSDSLLRGMGLYGAFFSVGKNTLMRVHNEINKDRPKLQKVTNEMFKVSPPISSKVSRINNAMRSFEWDMDEMQDKGWSLDNPAYLAIANIISATTNIPLDRLIKKTTNVVNSTNNDLELWQRLALLGGWQDWELGADTEKKENNGWNNTNGGWNKRNKGWDKKKKSGWD